MRTRERAYINICLQTLHFRGTAQQSFDVNDINLAFENTQRPWCIHLHFKIKRHFTKAFLKPVKPSETAPGLMKMCNNSRSDLPLRALIQAEDMLNICCELLLDKQ
jgi:hypothetical protein